MVFPVVMYGFESWTIKKALCQRIDAFKLCCWESPLDSKEIKPVNLKGKQPLIFFGRIDAEAEAPILWPPDVKSHPSVGGSIIHLRVVSSVFRLIQHPLC